MEFFFVKIVIRIWIAYNVFQIGKEANRLIAIRLLGH
jgi:hypothetical protein